MTAPIMDRRNALLTMGLGIVAGASGSTSTLLAAQEELVVVANARNPTASLPRPQLRKIFLGQTAFWHGVVPVRLLVRPDRSRAAKAFYESMLDMTPQAFRKHWDQLQLAGRGVAPKSCANLEELQKLVAWAPGSIGFALASESWRTKGVKQVKIV